MPEPSGPHAPSEDELDQDVGSRSTLFGWEAQVQPLLKLRSVDVRGLTEAESGPWRAAGRRMGGWGSQHSRETTTMYVSISFSLALSSPAVPSSDSSPSDSPFTVLVSMRR